MCSTVDSSPEIGSIGHAIDLGHEIFGAAFVPLLVGAPRLGRYTAFGNHFARSGWDSDVYRLDRHPTMRHHPITPMTESDLTLHIAYQTDKNIALFDLLQLEPPHEAIAERFSKLLAGGAEVVIFDIIYDAQLASIGRLLSDHASQEAPLFAVGSAGIEYALTAYWGEIRELPNEVSTMEAAPVDQLMVISGSASPVTANQIAHALENGFAGVEVPTADLANPNLKEATVQNTTAAALDLLKEGRNVIVHIARGPEDPRIETTKDQFQAMGYSDLDIKLSSGQILGRGLGAILRGIVEGHDLKRVAVAGGDTSSYVARGIGVGALQTKAPFVPATPICRAISSDPRVHDKEIVFKGGQIGMEDFFSAVKRGKA